MRTGDTALLQHSGTLVKVMIVHHYNGLIKVKMPDGHERYITKSSLKPLPDLNILVNL